jgi:hypothetical protein
MWSYKLKLDERKLQNMLKVDKRHNKVYHLLEKSVINMIGPCGLIIIVSHLCAVPILVSWALGGVQNK